MTELHRRIHSVSHFQVVLAAAAVEGALRDNVAGAAAATFTRHAASVTTAWDDNGQCEPHVEIAVRLEAVMPTETPGYHPVAQAEIEIGPDGIDVGNVISGDLARVDVPAGRYDLLVGVDARELFTARKVLFVLTSVA
jgi:hypothetical protein